MMRWFVGTTETETCRIDGGIGFIDAGYRRAHHAFGFVDKNTGFLRFHIHRERHEISNARRFFMDFTAFDTREILAAIDYVEAVANIRCWAPPQ
jgi:hypothetical protein